MAYVTLLLLAALAATKAADIEWHYHGTYGPANWKNYFPACGLTAQSPIDVPTASSACDEVLKPFQMTNYMELVDGLTISLTNNGHTLSALLGGPTSSIKVSRGGLDSEFEAYQFHFHWGSNNAQGSEHTVDSQAFPLEMHFIHRNTKYNNISMALGQSDGLLVFGTFVEIGNTNSKIFEKLDSKLSSIVDAGTTVSMDAFELKYLFPDYPERYYHYNGSLTTPQCQESVLWHVFEHKMTITAATLGKFRALKSESNASHAYIVDNFRPVQALNGRSVKQSFHPVSKEVGCKEKPWHYFGHFGPQKWKASYPDCDLRRQSPINMVSSSAIYNSSLEMFTMSGYDNVNPALSFQLLNNGHTFAGLINGPTTDIKVSRGGLDGEFKAYQFHFHWGSTDDKGSEHTYNSRAAPMELHFIHINKKYSDVATAIQNSDGLLVFGTYVEIASFNSPLFIELDAHIDSLREPLSEKSIASFALKYFFPVQQDKYYHYEGSLTTPGCQQAVLWHVFYSGLSIKASTLEKFRKLKSEVTSMKPHYIVDNYRPVQALNDRKIQASFEMNGSTMLTFQPLLAMVLTIVATASIWSH